MAAVIRMVSVLGGGRTGGCCRVRARVGHWVLVHGGRPLRRSRITGVSVVRLGGLHRLSRLTGMGVVGVIMRFRVLMARVYAMFWAFGVFGVFFHCSSVIR